MNWFYVQNGAQAGPVDDGQLDELVRTLAITADTLVWKEGMANWEPYRAARSGLPAFPSLAVDGEPVARAIPTAGGRACAQCGLVFPENEVVPLAGAYVCAVCKPLALQRMREGTWMGGSRRYGGFWIRVAAYLLDMLILTVGYYIIAIPLGLGIVGTGAVDAVSLVGFGLAYVAIGLALGIAYQIYFLTKFGATPGKMVLGLKVIRSDGGPITAGRATARLFAHGLSGIILYIGYIMVGIDSEKRGLHDHICDTRVVYKS